MPRLRRRPTSSGGLALVTALVLLPGCSTNQPPEVATAAAAAEVPEAPETWTGEEAAGDVEVGWIDSFEDPTLGELVREAQEHNKNLQAAAANVDRARALARQAGAALKPNVGLALGAAQSGVTGSSNQTSQLTAAVDISWEVDVWGRVRAGREGAVASAEAAAADYRFAQHSLAAGVARGYFLAIEAGRQEVVAQETVDALEETLRIVNLRFENGMVGQQEVSLAKSDLATARDRLVTVQGSRRDAQRALELLLGRYPAAELEVRDSLPDLPPSPPAGLPSQILERRPDLVAAERRVASAFAAADQARAARLPGVQLTGSLGGASSGLSSLLDPANLAWRAGASLLAPLFDGGARREQVEITTADQQQALAAYGDAALKAFGEVEASLDLGVVLSQRRDELKIAAQEAQEAYRIADLRYKEGESDLLDVLAVRQRVFAAGTNLVSVERQLLDQRVSLHLALGGSWEAE